MSKKIWLLVADEAIARIIERGQRDDGPLENIVELTDATAHATDADLRHDAQGRRNNSVTSSAADSKKHIEADAFAARVAAQLEEASQQGRFDELRLAAAPRFLGALRKALSPAVSKSVTLELDKDLIHLDDREVARRLIAA